MNIEAAIIAASGRKASTVSVQAAIAGMLQVKEWLDELGVFDTPNRLAHLLGQCGHESLGFRITEERLSYSAERLMVVWPSRFKTREIAEQYARMPRRLANFTYGGRMGNKDPGDGYKYRGRGYLQLTGKTNYLRFGRLIDVNLVQWPELAKRPRNAWKIAGSYFATRKRHGKTTLEWADENNVEQITRIVNGGTHGRADRRARAARALEALS